MHQSCARPRLRGTLAIFEFVILVVCSLITDLGAAQDRLACTRDTPYTQADVEAFIANAGIPDSFTRLQIERCGVSFILDVDAAQRLRSLGASDELVALISPPADPQRGARWTPPIDGQEMVWVSAGLYFLGSPEREEGREADETQHGVQMDRGFWLDVQEVTNEAYQRFILANPRWQKNQIATDVHDGNYLKDWNGNDFPTGQATAPVVNVSWAAAGAYGVWAGKRLPTEAEWEYAARAGTSSTYWWGDSFDPNRVSSDASDSPAPVERRSPWGLVDMIGGVWEWTSTLYSPTLFPYPYRADDGREDLGVIDGRRVVRGGYWGSAPRFLRVANRSAEPQVTTGSTLGFRSAR